MTRHLEEQLLDFVLGTLTPAAREESELHLRECLRCAREVRETEAAMALVAWAEPPAAPPSGGRERLLEAIGGELQAGRYLVHASAFAKFFEVSVERARALLQKASGQAAWAAGPIPGMELFHLLPGARFATADAGLVRFAPGVEFPTHRHLGEERTLIFEGGFRMSDGKELRAGEELVMPADSSHAYRVLEAGCLFALVLYKGVEIPGVTTIYTRH